MASNGAVAVAADARPFDFADFRRFAAARACATVAFQMQGLAVGLEVYDLTHRPLHLGYVGLAQFAPAIGLSLVAGHVADRYDRRRIAVFAHLAYAATSLGLCALAVAGVGAPHAIYAVLVLLGAARAFGMPAQQALVPHLVPAAIFPRAVAWTATVGRLSTIAGPALGGWAYHAFGAPAPVFALCAALSVGAALLTASIEARTGSADASTDIVARLVAGVRYVWSRPLVLGAISLDLFAVLLGGAVALLPVYARDILHVGAGGLGLLRSATAAGAAATAILLAYRPLGRRAGAIMLAAVALFGAATIVFGASTSFSLSLLALAVIGACDMVSVVMRLTLVQLETPEAMRGRVSAVNMAFINASNELGEFESGVTADWLGTVPSVIVGGIGTIAVVALWAWRFPELRKADLRR